MDISVLTQYFNVIVIGICLCVGYVIKTSIDCIPNKYIPAIMLVLGLVTNIVMNLGTGINADVILSGMISGLASTGLHQAFKPIINKEDK